ncbi:MAG: aminoglycoside phosphotransferase family protein [Flavobacteriaceae bacterium]|nr:aminoglycoside phosphotransferase family protein [Flavobacteriaceae bacterium]
MILDHLKSIFRNFDTTDALASYKELASGHINDTYLIKTEQGTSYILQRINHGVFKDVPGLISNKTYVSQHLLKKMSHLPAAELKRRVLSFIPATTGLYYHLDADKNYWNVMVFIHDSITYEAVTDENVAYEGGKLIGNFLNLTDDFDATVLIDVIPKFHDMSFRFEQFNEALQQASKERLAQAQIYIDTVDALKEEMHIIQYLKEAGKIKTRVTHNDTKISNILFDQENKGLCVIDTDTVMPGIVHYDFGDAIRTICNTASEDEQNLDLVHFNISYYKAYVKGFLGETKDALSQTEIDHLPLGAKTMIFIMALRFLTDFLNDDMYYKTTYAMHNLDRAKNQFKLIESLTQQYDAMTITPSMVN